MHKFSADFLIQTACLAGLVSEVLQRKKEMEVLTNLKNIVILDCDADTLYKKVCVVTIFKLKFLQLSFFFLCILLILSAINPASIIYQLSQCNNLLLFTNLSPPPIRRFQSQTRKYLTSAW